MTSIHHLREEYTKEKLDENLVPKNPFQLFHQWFSEALNSKLPEPNAMILASIKENQPEIRTVLLKEYNENGFVFFTNYNSNKGIQISKNNNVSILFLWLELERQIRINGVSNKLDEEASNSYFLSRPIGSQIGAIISPQSQVIESREYLENKMAEATEFYKNNSIQKPENWGGYIIKPTNFEFWQGRSNRLHDRINYKNEKENWFINRLAP